MKSRSGSAARAADPGERVGRVEPAEVVLARPREVVGNPLVALEARAVSRLRDPPEERLALVEPPRGPLEPAPRGRGQPAPVPLELERPVPPVAGEDVVPARAGKQDLHPVAPRKLADVEDIERCRVGERLVELRDHPLEVTGHAARLDLDRVELDAEVPRNALRVRQVVGDSLLGATDLPDREAVELRRVLAGERHDRTRIEPAGEKRPDRHIGDHLPRDSLPHMLGGSGDRGRLAQVLRHPPECGQLVPGPPPLDPSLPEHHRLARKQLSDGLERCPLPGAPEEAQVPVDRHRIELPHLRHEVEQPLDLAAVGDAGRRLRVVERLHPERIARDERGARAPVEERHREDAVEAAEHPLALLKIEVQDDLGVGMPAEGVPLRLEFRPQLAVVVDLAVEDELHGALERLHRLVPERREIDDREPRMAEADRGAVVEEGSGVIGAAVTDRTHSVLERAVGEPARVADDAAHRVERIHRPDRGSRQAKRTSSRPATATLPRCDDFMHSRWPRSP